MYVYLCDGKRNVTVTFRLESKHKKTRSSQEMKIHCAHEKRNKNHAKCRLQTIEKEWERGRERHRETKNEICSKLPDAIPMVILTESIPALVTTKTYQ